MHKIVPTKPLLIMLYGFPGAGKSHFARQLSEALTTAHVQDDRIRYELFENPRRDKEENQVVRHLMDYVAEEFLKAGVSVIYDSDVVQMKTRRTLRDMARKYKAEHLLIWLQVDSDSAFARLQKRDRRKTEDKYSRPMDPASFDQFIGRMQNPNNEDYMVISGKHTFNTQRNAVIKKLYEMGLIDMQTVSSKVVKPGLVNLIPNPTGGRVDISRRNIVIR